MCILLISTYGSPPPTISSKSSSYLSKRSVASMPTLIIPCKIMMTHYKKNKEPEWVQIQSVIFPPAYFWVGPLLKPSLLSLPLEPLILLSDFCWASSPLHHLQKEAELEGVTGNRKEAVLFCSTLRSTAKSGYTSKQLDPLCFTSLQFDFISDLIRCWNLCQTSYSWSF